MGVSCLCARGAGARHRPPEEPRDEANGNIRSVVGRSLDWRRCVGGEEVWHAPFCSCHKLSRVAALGGSLVEAWVDVGVLVEEGT